MQCVNWDAVSACANVLMALTALVAAIYALKQYRHSLKVQEMSQVVGMHQSLAAFFAAAASKDPDEHTIEQLFIMMELHERLIANGFLSSMSAQFYRDAMGIGDDFSVDERFVDVMREVLKRNEHAYTHVIKLLRNGKKTKVLVEW